jgi:butyryl-CoA dehydrogenase
MSYNIDPKQQAVRDEVRSFAEAEIAPISDKWDRMPEPRGFPHKVYRRLGEVGYLGYNIPIEYEGQGKSNLEFITMIEELCYFDAAFGLACGLPKLVTYSILQFGSDGQKEKYVADCATGRRIPAFALSEPKAGSDAAGIEAAAQLQDSEFLINGEKTFITHGDVADLALLFCKINGESRMSAILVETDQSGWKPRTLQHKMGVRATTTAAIVMEDVKAAKENLVGEAGSGLKYAMITLDGARVGVAAQAVGIAQRALDESISYSKKRLAFGAPIAKLQAIQWMIADMSTRLEASRLLTYKAALLQDNREKFSTEAAQAKLFATEAANFCVDRAMQIHGGYGYIGEFSIIEKLYRDQRFLEIGEGTSEIQRMVIANNIIGR